LRETLAVTDPVFTDTDRRLMARALELAARGLGRVEPNPMVGAVVAQGDAPIAEGWHAAFGGPHAEVVALGQAGEAAQGNTLYVTLEPCCHHGKTPPCTDAILAAGVRRVVVAMADPFPEVSGRGVEQLRAAGLQVDVGLAEDEARQLNAPFVKRHTVGRPYVIAKWAQTLDGRLATETGDSRWISSAESRQWVHTLRSRTDGILVGIGTAEADNPSLTVRLPEDATDYGRRPARIVLDPRCRLSPTSRLATTARDVPTLLVTCDSAPRDAVELLEACGVEVIPMARDDRGICLTSLLEVLASRDMTNLLVEGGPAVLRSFFAEQLVDRVAVFVAPKLIGGKPRHVAPGPFGLTDMDQALALLRPTFTPIGADVLIEGVLRDY
jgi:diaminohydroxyphosphoribosylaminopyrimidine deaminase / 5-amino-6-(5-phosphoribosylamino)uracil reductase